MENFEAKMEKVSYVLLMLVLVTIVVCAVSGGVFCVVSLVRWLIGGQ